MLPVQVNSPHPRFVDFLVWDRDVVFGVEPQKLGQRQKWIPENAVLLADRARVVRHALGGLHLHPRPGLQMRDDHLIHIHALRLEPGQITAFIVPAPIRWLVAGQHGTDGAEQRHCDTERTLIHGPSDVYHIP